MRSFVDPFNYQVDLLGGTGRRKCNRIGMESHVKERRGSTRRWLVRRVPSFPFAREALRFGKLNSGQGGSQLVARFDNTFTIDSSEP